MTMTTLTAPAATAAPAPAPAPDPTLAAQTAYSNAQHARRIAIHSYHAKDNGLFRQSVKDCVAHAHDAMIILRLDIGYGGLLRGDGQFARAARCALDIVEPLYPDPIMKPVAIEHLQDALQPLGDALGLLDTSRRQREARRRDRAQDARMEFLRAKSAHEQALADLNAARQVMRDAEIDYYALFRRY